MSASSFTARAADPEELKGCPLTAFPPPPDDLSSVAVFHYLRSLYGPPNLPSSDAVRWGWALTVEDGVLLVWGVYSGVWLGFAGEEASDGLKSQARALLDQLTNLRPKVAVQGEPVGGAITSPYRVFALMASELEAVARDLQPKPAEDERQLWPNVSGLARFARDMTDELTGRAARREAALLGALTAHILSVEGFLNIIYHLFLRPELADDRMRRRIEREELDLKLRLVGTYCDCFEEIPITRDDEEYKAFCFLTEVRKAVAHAKLTPSMEHRIVVVDERYPFFMPVGEAPTKYGITADPTALTIQMVSNAGHIAWAVVTKLIKAMKPSVKFHVLAAIMSRRIYYTRRPDGSTEISVEADELHAATEAADEFLDSGTLELSDLEQEND